MNITCFIVDKIVQEVTYTFIIAVMAIAIYLHMNKMQQTLVNHWYRTFSNMISVEIGMHVHANVYVLVIRNKHLLALVNIMLTWLTGPVHVESDEH